MFCTNCGNQLPDGSRFCIHCGSLVGDAPSNPAPAVQEPVQAAPQEPVSTAPVYPEPVFEAPAQEEAAYTELLTEEPIYQQPVYQQPIYQQPYHPVPQYGNSYSDMPVTPAPKKKKTGLIVAIVLILVLAIGGVGVFLYIQHQNQEAYDAAMEMLENRDYDGALAAFTELGSFEDAAEQADELAELQAKYDAAVALVNDHEYEEAAAAFKKLKDYRDSKEYVESKINYQRAAYLMESAAEGDLSAMSVVEGYGEDTAMPDTEKFANYLLYGCAAEAFEEVGDYADAADRASECWLNVALIELEWGEFSSALGYIEKLNDEDASALNTAYQESCADGQFLADIAGAFALWYDDADAYNFDQEIQLARDLIQPYTDRAFEDAALKTHMESFLNALDIMESSLDTDGYVYDWVTYYEGMAIVYALGDELQEGYSVFSGNADYMDWFVGYGESTAAYPYIEADIQDWYDYEASADLGADGHYYAAYTNYSGYDFTLCCIIYFYDADGNWLETSDTIELYVGKNETVHIPTIPETISDDDWYTFDMNWWFYVD